MEKPIFFNFDSIKENSKILIIGKFGKDNLIENILKNHIKKYNSQGISFSSLFDRKDNLIKIKNSWSNKNFNVGILKLPNDEIIHLVDDFLKLCQKVKYITFNEILIQDSWIENYIFKNMMYGGHSTNACVILSFDGLPYLPAPYISSFDYIMVGGDESYETMKEIYNNFVSCIPTFDEFIQLYNTINEHEFLIFRNIEFPHTFYYYNQFGEHNSNTTYDFIFEDNILNGCTKIGVNI